MGKLSIQKAKTILHDKTVRGHRLTDRQRRFMGFVAGGGKASRLGTSRQRKEGRNG